MLDKDLVKFGLNKGESKVYASLLKSGDASASEIAKKTGLGRTNIYDYANSLIRIGLVSEYEKNNKIFYRAENPDQIKGNCQSKSKRNKRVSNQT
jgi:HTH-type transcriptional regulator, sugar sensing transcriptional regulator